MAPLAFLAQKPWIVPIPGTTKLSRLEENIGAVDSIDAGRPGEIDAATAKIKAVPLTARSCAPGTCRLAP